MNTTIDEIEDIVFGIVETVDTEIETIDQNFTTFVFGVIPTRKFDWCPGEPQTCLAGWGQGRVADTQATRTYKPPAVIRDANQPSIRI